jgi:Zn-finger protein
LESHKFFANKKCKYFPCHEGIPTQEFNCLFCYCPLYSLGKECGGDYLYLENDIKSCEECVKPHKLNSYEYILANINKVIKLTSQKGHNKSY